MNDETENAIYTALDLSKFFLFSQNTGIREPRNLENDIYVPMPGLYLLLKLLNANWNKLQIISRSDAPNILHITSTQSTSNYE